MNDTSSPVFDVHGIMRRLPQRFPFLMLDRVVACDPGKSLTAIKNVTINEPYFQGHFPGLPLMPGVLILEALAQATGVLAFCSVEAMPEDRKFLFVGIDKARFKRQVVPGDQLRLHVEYVRDRRGIWVFNGEARVEEEVAATAVLMCADREL